MAVVCTTALFALAAPRAEAWVQHPLSVKEGLKNRHHWARAGFFPPGPRLRSVKGLKRGPRRERRPLRRVGYRKSALPHGARLIRLERGRGKRLWARGRRSRGQRVRASLFGYEGDFFAKRNTILYYIQGFYEDLVPRSGGTFTAPQLSEADEQTGSFYEGCGDVANNAFFCPTTNLIAWSLQWSSQLWAIGDNTWTSVIAHEYGHAAQQWLGYGSQGYFQYVVYREAFADCMSGAFAWSMYQRNYWDDVGNTDGAEFAYFFNNYGAAETTWDNHGTGQWRYANALYGWNYGWNGCVSQGNWIAAQ